MTPFNRSLLLLLFFSCLFAGELSATEKFAEKTGQECLVCHVDPAGGGELTTAGQGYALSLGSEAAVAAPSGSSALSHGFRLLVGYLHILFGIFWFGTILYVHLILKPGYASQGLPRGEVKLGLISILVMGVTGAILVAYRIPDAGMLIGTRFGILLLIKIVLYLIMAGSALLVVLVVGPRLRRKHSAAKTSEAGDLSLQELALFDGQEGRKAYIAYQGAIYDVTDSSKWRAGTHMGRHNSGGDLTGQLLQAPHGGELVQAMRKIGKLRGDEPAGLTPPQKLFYVMAYMNLAFVYLIILILACWKWW